VVNYSAVPHWRRAEKEIKKWLRERRRGKGLMLSSGVARL